MARNIEEVKKMTINVVEAAKPYLESGFAKTMEEAIEYVEIMINAAVESGLDVIVEI